MEGQRLLLRTLATFGSELVCEDPCWSDFRSYPHVSQTPKCYRAKVDKNPICSDGICLYPGLCGCGPSMPCCAVILMKCDMCGEGVFYDPCGGTCLRFKGM